MNRYLKISAALAAFALLLVVMGLSTQPTVQAQASTVTINVGNAPAAHIRSCDPYPARTAFDALGMAAGDSICPMTGGDNEFTITFVAGSGGAGPVEIYNTSLPTSGVGTGFDDNPRKFPANTDVPATLQAVSRTSGLQMAEN